MYAGTIIEGPSNVTYYSNLTPLPIELICNVTGSAVWTVNGTDYLLNSLTNIPGHSHNGTNILVNSPMNNTEYICVSLTNDGVIVSDPAYIVIAGTSVCKCLVSSCVASYIVDTSMSCTELSGCVCIWCVNETCSDTPIPILVYISIRPILAISG